MEIVNSVRFLFTNVVLAVLGGVFKDNLRTTANILGMPAPTLMTVNPFAALLPWILVQPRSEYHPVLDNSRSIVVAILYYHKRKKSWTPDNYRITWLADENGLPVSCRSMSITPVGDDVVPNVVLGYTTEKSTASTNARRAYFEALIWRFMFSGGNLANLPEDERKLAVKMTHTDENHDENSLKGDMLFKKEFAIGENVQRLLDEKCAPPTREAALEAEKRALEAKLAEEAKRAEAEKRALQEKLAEQGKKLDSILSMLQQGGIDIAALAAGATSE